MLEVQGLHVHYGDKQVLHGVDLTVGEGEIVALIGHNGAGKTTLLRSVLGLVPPAAGSIRFSHRPLPPGHPALAARAGLAFVPQGRHVFRDLTVRDNLQVALRALPRQGKIGLGDVFGLFPVLQQRLAQRAGSLSGGQQQMLALACALLREPRLLMLDEPSSGLAPVLVEEVFRTMLELRRRFGMAVLVVDQNVRRLLGMVDRVYVLKVGQLIYSGEAGGLTGRESLWELF